MAHNETTVFRDASPPAFTAEQPRGSHAAWWFRTKDGKRVGAYFTRGEAAAAEQRYLRALKDEVMAPYTD